MTEFHTALLMFNLCLSLSKMVFGLINWPFIRSANERVYMYAITAALTNMKIMRRLSVLKIPLNSFCYTAWIIMRFLLRVYCVERRDG